MPKLQRNETKSKDYMQLGEETTDEMILIPPMGSMFINENDKCKAKVSTVVAVIIVAFILISVISISLTPGHKIIHVVLIQNEASPVHITNSKFLSLGLDSSLIADGFAKFNMRDKKLRNMMRNLAPGYLRIGGTLADRLKFITNETNSLKIRYASEQDGADCAYEDKFCNPKLRPNFTMSGEEWLELYDLASTAGFTILFDLNCLTRNDNGSWDYENAEELIRFSNDNKMNVIWQLGNEPNSFNHVFNYTVNATQLARDFTTLRTILNNYAMYKGALLVGPDVTRPRPENTQSFVYLREFLANGGGHAVDAITFHQYYFNGRTVSSHDFLNIDIYNLLIAQTDLIKSLVSYYESDKKPIWLSETADAYGGGAPGYSNRFIGSFIWLDKLGIAAQMGLDVVIRQSFFKGFYALVDNNYDPTPDYWISALYKAFVGPEVVPCIKASSDSVRLYCQCTNKKFQSSAITLYGLNLKDSDAVIRIEGLIDPLHALDTIYSYVMSPYLTLFTKNIYLNNELLVLGPNGELPPFKPKTITNEVHVVIPPFSMAFFVIPTSSPACQ